MLKALAPIPDRRTQLRAFMEQVRMSLGHDLRTPLSTIVTCASVLEEAPSISGEARRDLLARIRSQAMQTAEMLQLLLDATLVAASSPGTSAIEPNALLQTIVAELEGEWVPRRNAPSRAKGPLRSDRVQIDPTVVGFAWRAYLMLDKVLATREHATAAVVTTSDAGGVHLDLGFSDPASEPLAPIDFEALPASGTCAIPRPHRLALRLARELIRTRDGELSLVGTLGLDGRMRIDFPDAP